MSHDANGIPPNVLEGQPIARVRRADVEYVLLGTAHVSRVSAAAVTAMLEAEPFDAVAVELCEPRYTSMRDPDAFRRLDLFQVIRQGKVGLIAANLALSAFQRRLAEQFGIEPGAEMKAAIDGAEARNLPVWLVDREIGTTLKRAYRSVGFLDRMSIVGGLGASLLTHDDVSEDEVEKLKQGDLLGSMFNEFARESPPLYEALIAERDRFMTASLRDEVAHHPVKRVLVVIGAGHLAGIERELGAQIEPAQPLKESCRRCRRPRRGRSGSRLASSSSSRSRSPSRSAAARRSAPTRCATGSSSPAAVPRSAVSPAAVIRSACLPRSSSRR